MRRQDVRSRIVTQDTAERVGIALSLVPPRILERVYGGVTVWEGNVVHGGLRRPGARDSGYAGDDRVIPYENTAWCMRRPDFSSIVTLPSLYAPERTAWPSVVTVLHEVGHAVWNAVIEPHVRFRVFCLAGEHDVRVTRSSGLMPALISVSSYRQADMGEQFAEAFSYWLSPPEFFDGWDFALSSAKGPRMHGLGERPWERLYYRYGGPLATAGVRASRCDWGLPFDNRRLLAFFNELAGFPADLPPRALR